MILRGLHVAHWCCIAELDLDDLPAGIVVLHGPNRTGKSSLVKAVRACLYDFDHDSGRAELKSCFPHNGAGPSSVAIDFETGGGLYRLTKVFSKRVDGSARLEKKSGDKFVSVEESPREAARKTRELLGADKSEQGLNQLLWVDQGIIALPEAGTLDTALEKQLVSVLGVMVTGGDLAFKQALDRRYEKWFGVRGDYRPTSSVTVLQKQSEQELKRLADLEVKRREVEQAIHDLDDCQAALPRAEKASADAQQELKELTRQREQSLERRRQYQQALRDCQFAEQQFKSANEGLEKYQASTKRWQNAEREAAHAEAALQVARQEAEKLAVDRGKQEQALQAARCAEQDHQRTREDIDDRSTLLKLTQRLDRLEKDLHRARELDTAVRALDEDLQRQTAPDQAALDALRRNWEKANELRVRLESEALTLAVALRDEQMVKIRIDGGPAEPLNSWFGERHTWPVRQCVAVEIPDLGAIEVGRRRENGDLEEAARQLDKLEGQFRDTALAFGEQPDEGCLNRLTERRVQREKAVARLDGLRKALQQQAPHGFGVLESERDTLSNQKRVLLQRRPDLGSWQASEDEIYEQLRSFQAKAVTLQAARQDLEKAEKQAQQDLKRAEDRLRECNEKAIRARTTAKNAHDELQRQGDELSLQAAVKQAEDALAAARQRLGQAELTEEEKTIDDRLQNAEAAAKLRSERCLQLQKEIERHRGRLESSAGLHDQLIDAETAVREVQDALARESLEAAAHKRLHDLFEQCRDSQVQQVMGPIADRVLSWTRTLGLNEYDEVRFGDRFLPEGLIRQNGELAKVHALEQESYGTVEQLSLLVRLALGGVLAKDEPVTAILDDPLAHADASKHRRILDIIRMAAEGNPGWTPPAGRLQVLIFTCHPDRFDHLPGVRQIDLGKLIVREA